MSDERVILTVEQAIELLPDRDYVHTFTNPAAGFMCGADWKREDIIDGLKKAPEHGIELTGETATRMGHGLCFWEGNPKRGRYIFVETKAEAA